MTENNLFNLLSCKKNLIAMRKESILKMNRNSRLWLLGALLMDDKRTFDYDYQKNIISL